MIKKLLCVAVLAFLAAGAAALEPQKAPDCGRQEALKAKNRKILVVYYSLTGNTKKVAEDIAAATGADTEGLTENKKRTGFFGFIGACAAAARGKLTEIGPVKRDPLKYDLVVIGTPIWAHKVTPAVRTYVTEKKGSFKNIAVFATSGGTSPDKAFETIHEITGMDPVASAGFIEKDLKQENERHYQEKLAVFVSELE
ncbi:MAG: hypothetical protein JW803_09510 [Endomicrobiales bacterium]|nr:hypothetical protein [Endomicrobiales bacterium]